MIPPKPLAGTSRMEIWLEQLRRYAISNRLMPSQDIDPAYGPEGTAALIKNRGGSGKSGVEIRRFKISTISEKWLNAFMTATDGTNVDETLHKIMRPAKLRYDDGLPLGGTNPAATDGEFQQRTYSLSVGSRSFTIAESIFPAYAVDDFIYAAKPVKGGTMNDDGGNPISWIDLNVDARHWLVDKREVEVCVGGVTMYMAILASPPVS